MSEGGPGKLRWRDLRPKRERRQWRPGLELSRALMNSNHTSTSSMTRRTRISEDLRRIIRSSWSISLLDLNRVRIARSPSPRNRQLFQLQKCLQARHQSQPGLSRLTGNQACHRLRNHPQCPHHRNSSTSLSQRQLRLPPQSRKRRPLLRSLKEVASPTCLRGSRSKTTRTRLQKSFLLTQLSRSRKLMLQRQTKLQRRVTLLLRLRQQQKFHRQQKLLPPLRKQ
mmetsp:Transcript_9564/g.28902  ORF Transcript_9564/g.28902 Transcript_9564/m.28902 type:complete len:225 (+) Transcript_9564:1034-1708(+)